MNPFSRRSVRESAHRGGWGWTIAGLLILLRFIRYPAAHFRPKLRQRHDSSNSTITAGLLRRYATVTEKPKESYPIESTS